MTKRTRQHIDNIKFLKNSNYHTPISFQPAIKFSATTRQNRFNNTAHKVLRFYTIVRLLIEKCTSCIILFLNYTIPCLSVIKKFFIWYRDQSRKKSTQQTEFDWGYSSAIWFQSRINMLSLLHLEGKSMALINGNVLVNYNRLDALRSLADIHHTQICNYRRRPIEDKPVKSLLLLES